jgi:hypothetical protein
MRLSRSARVELRRVRGRRGARDRQRPANISAPGHFDVLCRIDAYVDYVAVVDADSAEEAAEMAGYDHSAYQWERQGIVEFDDRFYVTLDRDGIEIEGTETGDR